MANTTGGSKTIASEEAIRKEVEKQVKAAQKEAEKALEEGRKQGEKVLKENAELREQVAALVRKEEEREVAASTKEKPEAQRMVLVPDSAQPHLARGIGPEGEAAHRANFLPDYALVRQGQYAEVVDANGVHKIVPTESLYTEGTSPGVEVQNTVGPANIDLAFRGIEEKLAPVATEAQAAVTGDAEGEPSDSAPTADMVHRQHIGGSVAK